MSSQFVSIGDLKNISQLVITSKKNLISYVRIKLLAMMFSWITSKSKLCWPQIFLSGMSYSIKAYNMEKLKLKTRELSGWLFHFALSYMQFQRFWPLLFNLFPIKKQQDAQKAMMRMGRRKQEPHKSSESSILEFF